MHRRTRRSGLLSSLDASGSLSALVCCVCAQKQQLLSSVKLGAVLGTIGLLSYTYFKISASFQTNAATSRRRIGEARMQ